MSITNAIVVVVVVVAIVVDVLMRRLDKINMAKNAAKGIEPSRGQKYPVYLWIIFTMAFMITIAIYYIHKWITQ